tara:strand:+ start:78 stop:341 length:264 start_codon:yes stop_codon:yes gene_type:complete
MAIVNKQYLIKKLKYRSIYSGSKESNFIFSKFATEQLKLMNLEELRSYEKFLELGDLIIWNWVSKNQKPPNIKDKLYNKFIVILRNY